LAINPFTGDTGSGGLEGSVPAPPAGSALVDMFLSASGAWEIPPAMIGDTGSGGVVGLVPAPPAGSAASGMYLNAAGTWSSPSGGSGGSQPYDLVVSLVGMPGPGAIVFLMTMVRSVSFPLHFVGSYGTVGTNPTANLTYEVLKNGLTGGYVYISTSGAVTFETSGGAFTCVAGDRLTVVAPTTQDATLADVAITLTGTR
jgi:hypothetical protein